MTERQTPTVWVGEEEMSSALLSLCKQRPVAASKVKVAAKIALKYSNDYKMAVHSIEGFIRKAAPADKLCGVYVLDAICRQPKSQMFRERFAIRSSHISSMIAYLRVLKSFCNSVQLSYPQVF
jgi:hypothetical protein